MQEQKRDDWTPDGKPAFISLKYLRPGDRIYLPRLGVWAELVSVWTDTWHTYAHYIHPETGDVVAGVCHGTGVICSTWDPLQSDARWAWKKRTATTVELNNSD